MMACRTTLKQGACRLARLPFTYRRGIMSRASAVETVTATIQSQDPSLADLESSNADRATAMPANGVNAPAHSDIPSGMNAKAPKPKPAEMDALNFKLHPSVEYWRNFESNFQSLFTGEYVFSDTQGLTDMLTGMVNRVAATARVQDANSAAFWAYHSARITFFIGQAVAGLVAHHMYSTVQGSSSSSGAGAVASSSTPLTRLVSAGATELTGRVNEALATFSQDYENIQAGAYPLPWDMTSLSHRQYSPLWQLGRTALFMQNAVSTLTRRLAQKPDEVWLRGPMYPQYYTNTFHYQGDGWFSDSSARVYEHSTEVLFFGRQDAMQRTTLLPVAEYMQSSGKRQEDVRLLEVAAGTGRFHTFVKDAYPRMPTVCSDLSPFYLARARENVRYWKSLCQPTTDLGGVDGTGVTYQQMAAEKIDAADESFDVVACVYLFHELPEAVRRKAVAEWFRVLKPGGIVSFTDSTQLGDRPTWDISIKNFGDFNEPYYVNYVECDLGALFAEAGFQPNTKYVCSASKTLSFTKPVASASAPV